MAIILVPQPGSSPSSLTDWTDSVESLKQYNLGVNKPVDYNFDGNTIKKGVLITIGGSNYYCNADTAISGTASDYVKITSAGVASYVTDLTGVSWNDTYNFYADSSGNAYIFNEAKAGLANTVIGAFAEHGYFTEMEVIGIASFESDEIIMHQPLKIGSNLLEIESYAPRIFFTETASINQWTLIADADQFFIRKNGTANTIMTFYNTYTALTTGNFLIGTTTDNGTDKLQVNGSASFSGVTITDIATFESGVITMYQPVTIDGTNTLNLRNINSTSTLFNMNLNPTTDGTAVTTDAYLRVNRDVNTSSVSNGIAVCIGKNTTTQNAFIKGTGSSFINANNGNLLVGTTTDNGTNKLQVNGSASFSGGVTTDNVAIKHKYFTGTLDSGGDITFNHGLALSKIIAVQFFGERTGTYRSIEYVDAVGFGITTIFVRTTAPYYALSPYRILVTYQA